MSGRFFTACLAILFASASVSAGEIIPLPDDPARPVIEMWYVDGGQVGPPEIAVFAGGRVRVRVGEGDLWGELTSVQVQNLVSQLLREDRLSQVTSDSIEAAIARESARTGLSCEIKAAGDTIIRVHTAQKTYRVDGRAVGLLRSRFPDAAELQLFYAAQCRLENVRAVVMVGGTPAAERLAKLAQSQLLAESGEQIAVGLENLTCVHSLNDGTRCCQFVVPAPQGDHGPRIISLFESPGETPRVSVLPTGSAIQ